MFQSSSSSSSNLSNNHHLRNSYSDSHLDRAIKQERNMGDNDENQGNDSIRGDSIHHNTIDRTITDMTEAPLTEEEFSMLEGRLREEGQLGTNNTR